MALKVAGVAALCFGATALTYKAYQVIADERFPDGPFPSSFRRELVRDHVAMHGWCCPRCDEPVRYSSDLTVDHIVARTKGGMTSRMNAELLCRSCNASKGARTSLLDLLRGRSS